MSDNNTALGKGALTINTTGLNNTAVGAWSSALATDGDQNSAFGTNALLINDSSSNNTAIGVATLMSIIDNSDNNTAVGANAGEFLTSGSKNNVAIGAQALSGKDGDDDNASCDNVAVGYQAGMSNSTGQKNTYVGYQAGHTGTVGHNNVCVGNESGLNSTGESNAFLGCGSGLNSQGIQNTYIGRAAGKSSLGSTGINNVAVGFEAGVNNTSGTNNVCIGVYSGTENTTGQKNTYVGYRAGQTGQTGSDNFSYSTAIGANAQITSNNQIMLGGKNDDEAYPTVVVNGGIMFPGGLQTIPYTGSTGGGGNTLSAVLLAGNNAGATGIDMNQQNITEIYNLSIGIGDAPYTNNSLITQNGDTTGLVFLNNALGGTIDFRTASLAGAFGISLKLSIEEGNEIGGTTTFYDDTTFLTIPLSTAVQPASNDSSTKIPTTAWVQSAITSIPASTNSTTTIVVQPINSTPVSVPIPTDCIKFDIAVYGSGGLSTPAIYYPAPNPQSTEYTIQCGAGGGGGFAKIAGIYQPKQVTQKVNTLSVTMNLDNGNYTLVSYNEVILAQVYNGSNTTATQLAGGAGCSTQPVVSTLYGSWFSSNGTQGESGADRGLATTPLNLQGGQNIAGGALVNTQMGVGQSYASYSSSLASWSASPIGYGGAVITFYA